MSSAPSTFSNRITRMLGVEIPIANAPMGGIVNPALVSAIADTGAIGLVPGSLGSVNARQFIRTMRELTDRPFGVNIPVSFTDAGILDTLLEQRIRFVTTSTGPIPAYTPRLRANGIKVLHVVTSLDTAKQAADAGVDGLIVEGSEGGGLRGSTEISMMVLLPLITSRIDLPVIAAGGIVDGASMAAAFALGAEGVQMGTRFLASAESAVHNNFKQAVVSAAETDTIMINRHNQRPIRVLRTKATEKYEFSSAGDPFKELMPDVPRLYQQGDMEVGFACAGQSSGRIAAVLPATEIVRRTVAEFITVIRRLNSEHRTN